MSMSAISLIFKYYVKFHKTMLTDSDKDINTCQFCNESFGRANELAIHYQEKHPGVFIENKD